MLRRRFALAAGVMMPLRVGGVDDEVAIHERAVALHRLRKAQVRAHLTSVPPRELGHGIETFRVDVHKNDLAARETRR